ncbi:hypothetical protein [Halalkalibacter urbisdiaboli]|uniref:hypothetical protein n=1 Tax=Halalkalibacter urbisdiaboli TaxID=1960589 RepID=UPI000B451BA3|nr:hypothetical protein [Halalkalibacter urbisdiaboli]
MNKNKFIASGLIYFVAIIVWVIIFVSLGAFFFMDYIICGVFLYLGIKNYRQYKKAQANAGPTE